MARFYISLLVVGVILLALGGWIVRGVRWVATPGRGPKVAPAT